jgi:tetratricopeptide (TPR) repeat protein
MTSQELEYPRSEVKAAVSRRHEAGAVVAVCLFLALAAVLLYGRTLGHEFINLDDNVYVYENEHVKPGLTLAGIGWAFSTGHGDNWHPLTWISHMFDCQTYGLWPGGHHLTNVLLHAATAVLLFLVLRQMTGDLWPSAMTAALFAVHPLRVESVAWVAERKDMLSGLFFVLTLGAYARFVRGRRSGASYAAVVVLFALGLMAKPMLVTLPFVLLLLDYWPLGRLAPGSDDNSWPTAGRQALRLVIEKLPLFALAAVSCLVTALVQRMAMKELDHVPFPWRLANAVVAYVAYLGQMIYPAGLTIFYPHPQTGLPAWKIVGAVLVLGAVTVVSVVLGRKRPYAPVGWFWYLGMAVPVIGLVQVGIQAMADRYTYLPQIGIAMLAAWGAADLLRARPWGRKACWSASIAVLAALMGCTWHQVGTWKDPEALWNHALDCVPRNARAYYNLGNHARDKHNDMALAMEYFRAAIEADPQHADAHHNLALCLASQGNQADAAVYYQRALELTAKEPTAHCQLATILQGQRRLDKAVEHFRIAVELAPDYTAARVKLGLALVEQGHGREAVDQWREGIRRDPRDLNLWRLAAWTLATHPEAAVRNGQEAVVLAEGACARASGQDPVLLDTLAAAYAEAGRFPEAVKTAERAVDMAAARGQRDLEVEIRARLDLYRAGQPYHDRLPTPRQP